MKKVLGLVLTLLLIISVGGCGKKKHTSSTPNNSGNAQEEANDNIEIVTCSGTESLNDVYDLYYEDDKVVKFVITYYDNNQVSDDELVQMKQDAEDKIKGYKGVTTKTERIGFQTYQTFILDLSSEDCLKFLNEKIDVFKDIKEITKENIEKAINDYKKVENNTICYTTEELAKEEKNTTVNNFAQRRNVDVGSYNSILHYSTSDNEKVYMDFYFKNNALTTVDQLYAYNISNHANIFKKDAQELIEQMKKEDENYKAITSVETKGGYLRILGDINYEGYTMEQIEKNQNDEYPNAVLTKELDLNVEGDLK